MADIEGKWFLARGVEENGFPAGVTGCPGGWPWKGGCEGDGVAFEEGRGQGELGVSGEDVFQRCGALGHGYEREVPGCLERVLRAGIAAVRKELRRGGSTKRDLGRDGGSCESGGGLGEDKRNASFVFP